MRALEMLWIVCVICAGSYSLPVPFSIIWLSFKSENKSLLTPKVAEQVVFCNPSIIFLSFMELEFVPNILILVEKLKGQTD